MDIFISGYPFQLAEQSKHSQFTGIFVDLVNRFLQTSSHRIGGGLHRILHCVTVIAQIDNQGVEAFFHIDFKRVEARIGLSDCISRAIESTGCVVSQVVKGYKVAIRLNSIIIDLS